MNLSTESKATGLQALQYWHKIVILLCLGWVIIWIYRPVLTAIFPEVQATIGPQSNAALGLIASCYFFAYTAMQIPAGILVDKYGQRAVLIPGFAIFIIASIVVGSATNIQMIYIGSILAGLGCGSYYGSAYSLSAQYIPSEHRGFATAIINTGSALGMGLSLIGTSVLVKTMDIPWNYMLFVIAALLILMIIAFAIILKKPIQRTAKVETTTTDEPEVKASIAERFFSKKMIASYIMYFATCYAYYMIVSWLPNFLETERGFEGASIGSAASIVAFTAIPGALIISKISDKFNHKRISFIVALQILAALMLLLTVQAHTITILLTGLVFYGLLGKLTVEPILISYVADNASKTGYGTTFGVFNFFGMSSSVIAPPLTGFLADMTGTKITGFYVAVAILIIATTFFLFINLLERNKAVK